MVELFGNGSNEIVVTSSKTVAELFEKRHDHVMRDIELLRKDVPNFGEMFFNHEEKDFYGRKQRVYLMNRDGLSLVAMGFNGPKAIKFKLDFIAAFNQLEDMLKRIREERTNTLIERKGKGST